MLVTKLCALMQGKLKNVEDAEVFFSDVAGIDGAKQELSEIVDFFNFPERYGKSGARSPRGCLLYGPPGTSLYPSLYSGSECCTRFTLHCLEVAVRKHGHSKCPQHKVCN